MEDWIQKCDSGFNLYHKTDLVTGGSIHKRTERFILMQENSGDIPEKVLKLFVKAKYGARMRYINSKMKSKDGTGNKGRATTVRDLQMYC